MLELPLRGSSCSGSTTISDHFFGGAGGPRSSSLDSHWQAPIREHLSGLTLFLTEWNIVCHWNSLEMERLQTVDFQRISSAEDGHG